MKNICYLFKFFNLFFSFFFTTIYHDNNIYFIDFFISDRLKQLCIDQTRRNCVDPYSIRGQFFCRCLSFMRSSKIKSPNRVPPGGV